MKFDIGVFEYFFEKLSRKLKFNYNPTRITGTLREDKCTFLIIPCSILLRMRNSSDKIVEKIETHILCSENFVLKVVPYMR
jgi:hypothetical protein